MVKVSDGGRGPPVSADAIDATLLSDLVQTLRIWPWDIAMIRQRQPGELIGLVQAALVRARHDGLSGHWAYDINRHRQLVELR